MEGFNSRFMDALALLNPRHLFHSANFIATCKLRQDDPKARQVVRACTNPTDGSTVPVAARLAGCVPANVPICMGLLTARGIGGQIFWQWINQTYNCLFNHYQASKAGDSFSAPPTWLCKEKRSLRDCLDCLRVAVVEEKEIATAYGVACAASIGLSVGLSRWVSRLATTPAKKRLLSLFVPYAAVAGAGAANSTIMRAPQMKTGIPVYDQFGELAGMSTRAARRAAALAAASRAAMAFPILALPVPAIALLAKSSAVQQSSALRLGSSALVVSLGLVGGLPFGMALFPQRVAMRKKEGGSTFFDRGI